MVLLVKSFQKLVRRFSAPLSAHKSGAASQVQATIQRALAASGIGADSATGSVQQTIQDALRQAGLVAPATGAAPAPDAADVAHARGDTAPPPAAPGAGGTTRFTYTGAAGSRAYTLFVPDGLDPDAVDGAPLMLMLHGCTQSPDDFATGTRMNAVAAAHGVLVAYPEQTPRDNGSRCWNWFRRDDQQRGAGEPAILAGIVGEIATRHRVDPRRVYVAGLSAGAAMAVILGRTYPERFAAVGAHSGLPFGAAHDVPGAFAAMQGRGTARVLPTGAADAAPPVPTIVLHGTADRTVQVDNGRAIVDDAIAGTAGTPPLQAGARETLSINGRDVVRTAFRDAQDQVRVEHVVIEGAGHTWSGGDPAGSHTDPKGPDASALILEFCLRQSR